jgi:serine/threonine-protein kinase
MIKPGMFISDRYEIVDKVGSGGMADVYKAKCHRLNRYVAIKILKPEYSSDKNFVAKFRGEAQSVAGLSHPNIVNVYDVGDDDGLYYIVMELVEGITLKKFIERKGKLEIKEAVGITIQIAQGMEAAHDNHIIHRDIKPQNIIISRDGKVKVTDFGIAKAATANTVTQNAIGSVHYLSPEQARGGYSDEKSDIYSLGVTLYEMLSGEVPFAGDNSVSVALLHIQGEARPLRELNPDVPVSVEKIVQKCMQKKPERRYLTASDLISDLKRSIINKDGDYVVIASGAVTDSPTIHLTDDEMNHIKSAAKTPVTTYDNATRDKAATKLQKEEEEELDTVDSKLEKALLFGMIGAAVLLGCVVLFIVIKFLGAFDPKDPSSADLSPTPSVTVSTTVTPTEEAASGLAVVPQVIGLTSEMAKESLLERSETFTILYAEEEEYDDTIPAGSITKQDPPAGTEVSVNATITLTISAGAEPFELPDVYNRTYEDAKKQLEENGLVVAPAVYEANEELEEGMVIRTEPARTTDPANPVLVTKGQEIRLIVSSGSNVKKVKVPSVLGMDEKSAKKELQKFGLQLGEKTYINSDVYADGFVCLQSYTEGQEVPEGTAINISISIGPEDTEPTPDPGSTDPTPTETAEAKTYSTTVTITTNPFQEGESDTVYLELEQDGSFSPIIEKQSSYETFESDFSNIYVVGDKEGTAVVHMYIGENDTPFPESWSVYLAEESAN